LKRLTDRAIGTSGSCRHEGVKLLLTRETLTVEEFPTIRSKVAPAQQHTTIPPQDEITPLTPAEC
jgi:hypothetical protein